MIAVVTGGRRGIGLAITHALQAHGMQVCVIAKSESGPGDLYIQADLSDPGNRFFLLDKVVKEFGRIDVLVNNAGVQVSSPALVYSEEAWTKSIELMLTAPFDLSKQAARLGATRIINIASVGGITGTRGIVAYSVAKAGLVELTKCLSNEWLPNGITVNAIAPGFIETEMQALEGEHLEAMLGRIPAGRLGTSAEVAAAVLWLIEASYVSGICLPVDGGWLAR